VTNRISENQAFLVNYLDLPAATGMNDADWEVFQLQHLNNPSLLDITNKSRQVGWSWLAAAEAVARSCIKPRALNIFVSINQEDAGEKIRYSKVIIEALDKEVRPKLITDNKMELEFSNGSRLISHPCRPVRGKAQAAVYLDEFAHYAKDREIYQSAVPVISKGGYIRIGSSPLGASGVFWEIYTETMKRYPGYTRRIIPWWGIKALCKDLKAAREFAGPMTTEERVMAFGTPRLIDIFENMILEDFQQEYECAWVDESVAWIDWELIKRNQALDQEGNHYYETSHTLEGAFDLIEKIAQAEIGRAHV
jgi:phage FluMu gp28-like protein